MGDDKKSSPQKTTESKKGEDIYTALLTFQGKDISIAKSKKNDHFGNEYADINEVLSKVKKELSNCGILLLQTPREKGLTTVLRHVASGTEVSNFIAYSDRSNPQKLGSNITYLRRYSLVSLLGLEADDDDGNASSGKASAAKQVQRDVSEEDAYKMLRGAVSQKQLVSIYSRLPDHLKNDPEVIGVASEVKQELINQEAVIK